MGSANSTTTNVDDPRQYSSKDSFTFTMPSTKLVRKRHVIAKTDPNQQTPSSSRPSRTGLFFSRSASKHHAASTASKTSDTLNPGLNTEPLPLPLPPPPHPPPIPGQDLTPGSTHRPPSSQTANPPYQNYPIDMDPNFNQTPYSHLQAQHGYLNAYIPPYPPLKSDSVPVPSGSSNIPHHSQLHHQSPTAATGTATSYYPLSSGTEPAQPILTFQPPSDPLYPQSISSLHYSQDMNNSVIPPLSQPPPPPSLSSNSPHLQQLDRRNTTASVPISHQHEFRYTMKSLPTPPPLNSLSQYPNYIAPATSTVTAAMMTSSHSSTPPYRGPAYTPSYTHVSQPRPIQPMRHRQSNPLFNGNSTTAPTGGSPYNNPAAPLPSPPLSSAAAKLSDSIGNEAALLSNPAFPPSPSLRSTKDNDSSPSPPTQFTTESSDAVPSSAPEIEDIVPDPDVSYPPIDHVASAVRSAQHTPIQEPNSANTAIPQKLSPENEQKLITALEKWIHIRQQIDFPPPPPAGTATEPSSDSSNAAITTTASTEDDGPDVGSNVTDAKLLDAAAVECNKSSSWAVPSIVSLLHPRPLGSPAPSLNVSQIRCFQNHQDFFVTRGITHPIHCMLCFTRNDQPANPKMNRWFCCVFCYLRVCEPCRYRVRELVNLQNSATNHPVSNQPNLPSLHRLPSHYNSQLQYPFQQQQQQQQQSIQLQASSDSNIQTVPSSPQPQVLAA